VTLSFRAGAVPGAAVWNFAAAESQDTLLVTGTEGRAQLSVFGNEPLRVTRGGSTTEIERPNPQHVQQPLIQAVVDDLLGRGVCPSTGESAARTSRVIDEALAGYYGGRGDSFWLRPDSWPGRRRA
jgi:hypothetical protein